MEDTIFSKIINKEIPSEIIYEDDDVMAFLDITPINPGATLVVPKKQSRNILDIDSESWGKVMEVVRIIAPIVKEVTNADGINIMMNNEKPAGQMVFHSHVHVIPRHENDDVPAWHGKEYKEGEMVKMAEKLREGVKNNS